MVVDIRGKRNLETEKVVKDPKKKKHRTSVPYIKFFKISYL